MKQQITVTQYRNIDLTILAIAMAVTQALIHFAVSRWFPEQLFVVSPVGIVVALVMMRWGGWAVIHSVLGGFLFALLSDGNAQHILIFGAGNAFALLALILLKCPGKEKIRTNPIYTLLFGFCVQGLMLLGRATIAVALGFGWSASLGFITTDTLSILFTMVAIWVIRRIDGLFEDQIHYLLRTQEERSVEGREQM